MNSAKKKRLEAGGWTVGTTAEFLSLSSEEAAYIERKRLKQSSPGSAQIKKTYAS